MDVQRLLILEEEIFEELDNMDEKDKYTWTMSLAANLLHDIPDSLRKEFLKNYEKLRAEVNELYGVKFSHLSQKSW